MAKFNLIVGFPGLTLAPKSAFNPSKEFSLIDKIICYLVLDVSVAIHNTGIAYFYHGLYDIAESIIHKALSIQNSNIFSRFFGKRGAALSWSVLGNTYRALNRHNEALQAYQNAVKLNPRRSITWYRIGDVYSLINDFEGALLNYQKAVKLSSTNLSYRASLIKTLYKLGKDGEAVEQEKIARAFMHKASEYDRACFESVCGHAEEALRLLSIALDQKQIDIEGVQQNLDFDFIHDDPRFKELVG